MLMDNHVVILIIIFINSKSFFNFLQRFTSSFRNAIIKKNVNINEEYYYYIMINEE